MRLRSRPHIRFAGQITGVEGYVESAAMGLLGRAGWRRRKSWAIRWPRRRFETATGALVTHITGGAEAKTFQPMNVNFGLFPPIADVKGGRRNRNRFWAGGRRNSCDRGASNPFGAQVRPAGALRSSGQSATAVPVYAGSMSAGAAKTTRLRPLRLAS